MLIERYAGALPLWISPVQVVAISLTERNADYVKALTDKLIRAGIRAELDIRDEKVGKKIREAQLAKVPYMLIIGDKETETGDVAVRSRSGGDLGTMSLDAFVEKVLGENRDKK